MSKILVILQIFYVFHIVIEYSIWLHYKTGVSFFIIKSVTYVYIYSNLFGSVRFTLTRRKLYLKIRAIRYIGIRVEHSIRV